MPESVKIIENGMVVTCDARHRVGPMALLIRGDRIAEIAPHAESFRVRYPAAEVFDASARVVVPGFVDAHYHGESFILRHWTTSIPCGEWIHHPKTRVILSHVHRELSAERLGIFYRLAYFAALRAGITFINEFGINNLDLPFLAAVEGFRRTDLQGMIAVQNGDQFDRARSLSEPHLRFAVALPPEEELTTYNMQTALRTARDLKWNLAVQAGEVRHGLDVFRRNFQSSLVQVLKDYRFLDNRTQLIHFSQIDAEEVTLLQDTGTSVICCPSAAIAKQSILPPLHVLVPAGIPLALGSDWGAPDPFTTMRGMITVARAQGVRTLTALDVLSMHTIGAARALGVDSDRGSLEAGKRADLAFIDASDFRLSYVDDSGAVDNTLMNLLLDAGSSAITDVMIGGEFYLRGGHIMTYAEEDLRREAAEVLQSLYRVAGEPIAEKAAAQNPPARVFPLPPAAATVRERRASFEDGDEGFRVIRRGIPPPPAPSPAEPETKPPPRAEPPRRVFGEDES